MKEKKILVLGATGQQGGATVRHLLADGWVVLAFTRDLSSHKSLELSKLGAKLVLGDIDDIVSLDAAMQGVYGVFSVQPPDWNPSLESNNLEKVRGKAVADAALKAGIQHFVYTSVGGADEHVRYRDAKWEIEQYIQTIGLPATILRPATFMDNFLDPLTAGVQNKAIAQAINRDTVLPVVAVEDIGAFTSVVFANPTEFLGKTIEIAGDELTPAQIAEGISGYLNHTVPYVEIPMEAFRQYNEILAGVFQWYSDGGHKVDVASVRKIYPGLMNFETWLKKQDKTKLEVLYLTEQA